MVYDGLVRSSMVYDGLGWLRMVRMAEDGLGWSTMV